MRISDWSSDVCSSDLAIHRQIGVAGAGEDHHARLDRQGDVGAGARGALIGADVHAARQGIDEIGRASCRARVCQYVEILEGLGLCQKKIVTHCMYTLSIICISQHELNTPIYPS